MHIICMNFDSKYMYKAIDNYYYYPLGWSEWSMQHICVCGIYFVVSFTMLCTRMLYFPPSALPPSMYGHFLTGGHQTLSDEDIL